MIKRRETQWAAMEPDVYAGKTCDQVQPRWKVWAEGDKGGADHQQYPLKLAARTFPAGTLITIAEPVCPQCDEPRSPKYPSPKHGPMYVSRCRCGFDWDKWVIEQFS